MALDFPLLGRAARLREAGDDLEQRWHAETELELAEARSEIEHLVEESLAAAKLAIDDAGWIAIGVGSSDETEFTLEQHKAIARIARAMAVTHPLVRRGINLRVGYVWGSGVQISAAEPEEGAGGQDVNAVVQAFLDDPSNRSSLTGGQAHEENERQLATDGAIYFALFTDNSMARGTGRVQVRSIHPDEVTKVITNPDDRDEPWYYERRVWVEEWTGVGDERTSKRVQRITYHPAMGYTPGSRPKTDGRGHDILWDAPVKHVTVNRLNGWKQGLGDVYTALMWARMYSDFLVDWARLMKSLSKLAWQAQTKGGPRAGQMRDRLSATDDGAGGTLVTTDNVKFEAVSKSGATLDSESGKPLAAMIAAGLDVPVTQLLTDPGVTGARATAETLDRPTYLAMGMRRSLWTEVFQDICGYVVEQAIRAPRGPLNGATVLNPYTQRLEFALAGDQDRTIDVKWPALDDVDPLLLVEAIVKADATGKLPEDEVCRLLLHALGVEDVDGIMERMLDDEGNFRAPDLERALADERRREQGAEPEQPS